LLRKDTRSLPVDIGALGTPFVTVFTPPTAASLGVELRFALFAERDVDVSMRAVSSTGGEHPQGAVPPAAVVEDL